MDFANPRPFDGPPGACVTRVDLSIGSLDLLQFVRVDHAFPRHSHDHFTVGVFDVGCGSLRYRRATWKATDASILAVTPDEVHEAEPSADGGWTYRTMYPPVSLVAMAVGVRPESLEAFFPRPIVDDPQLSSQLGGVYRALRSSTPDLHTEEALLGVLRRLVTRHAAARESAPVCTSARAVALAREYIDAHYARPVTLAELSIVCDTSPFHLIRSFRDAVGMPPHAYLTQVRATRARDLLLRGETPAGAAYLCGFCDQSHLTRTFKRFFGVTPGAYVQGVTGSAWRSSVGDLTPSRRRCRGRGSHAAAGCRPRTS